MHDELPASPTTGAPTADATVEPTADSTAEPIDDRRERDDRPERGAETPATGPAPRRSRDGVDPPDDTPAALPDDDRDCGGDDPDEEPLAYRLERLRLWRTLAALAVVVARLIRSL